MNSEKTKKSATRYSAEAKARAREMCIEGKTQDETFAETGIPKTTLTSIWKSVKEEKEGKQPSANDPASTIKSLIVTLKAEQVRIQKEIDDKKLEERLAKVTAQVEALELSLSAFTS